MQQHDVPGPQSNGASPADAPDGARRPLDAPQIAAAMARAVDAVARARALAAERGAGRPAPVLTGARAATTVGERLRASEARFHTLVEVAGHATWTMDAEGRVVGRQPAWQAFTGQTFAEASGADGYGWVDALHPADRDETLAGFRAAIAAGANRYEQRVRVRRLEAGGGFAWCETLVRMAPVRDPDEGGRAGTVREWVGVNVDVTELAAAEAALRESESRLRALADAVPAIVWSTDPVGELDHCNGWCLAFVGRPLGAMRGAGWAGVLHPDDVARVRALAARAVETGAPFDTEFRVRRAADGEYRWHVARGLPVHDAEGRITRWFGAAVDIHDRRLAEAAERAARADAEVARGVAEAATAAKGRVLAAASHDLRTPLAAIAGYAELLALEVYGPLTDEQRTTLARSAVAQRRLHALINDILEAARAESGVLPLTIADVPLEPVCGELEALIAPQVDAKRLAYGCEIGGDAAAPLVARADRARVLQILVNLVGNAVKHTPPGGRVSLDAAADAARVYVRVHDTGGGIAADQLEAIFQPFVQLGPAPAGGDGVGLGLATSRELARRMGGEVTAESTVGVGSTFTLALRRGGEG
jgi:PAS domain S-box-containing protein